MFIQHTVFGSDILAKQGQDRDAENVEDCQFFTASAHSV